MMGRIAGGVLVVSMWCIATTTLAELTVTLDETNSLVLEAESLELLALEFQSPSGSLIPADVAGPFQGVLHEEGAWALYYNLGTPFTLNGSLRLETQWDPAKRNDILFQYGTPKYEVGLQPITGHELFAGQVGPEPVIAGQQPGDLAVDLQNLGLTLGFAAWAGRGGVDLFLDSPLTVTALTLSSAAGELIPRGPFEFASVLQESPLSVHLSSPDGVLLDGEYRLPIGWAGTDFQDLTLTLSTLEGATLSAHWLDVRNLPEPSTPSTHGLAWLLLLSGCARHRRVVRGH